MARAGAHDARMEPVVSGAQRAQALHLPRLRATRRRTPPLGGPQPSFCDLEEHNALSAHLERQRLARDIDDQERELTDGR